MFSLLKIISNDPFSLKVPNFACLDLRVVLF